MKNVKRKEEEKKKKKGRKKRKKKIGEKLNKQDNFIALALGHQ
jgi:hypothetical protein